MIAISSASVIGDLERHDRYVVQTGALRRAPAPFAGEDFVGIGGCREPNAPRWAG